MKNYSWAMKTHSVFLRYIDSKGKSILLSMKESTFLQLRTGSFLLFFDCRSAIVNQKRAKQVE
jgi:hypothetical protein